MAESLEEPAYTVQATFEGFEVRRYVDTIQARVQMQGGDRSGGFRRVARYIFGDNNRGDSIAMTAPVSMWDEGEGSWLAFTMPSAYTLDALPAPHDSGVNLIAKQGGDVAVLSFTGRTSQRKVERLEAMLRASVQAEGYTVAGPSVLAIYENPWTTLPFLRRNEVQLPVKRE
jgi:hypothetical protein